MAKKKEETSEYGMGLVYNLVLFINHFDNKLFYQMREYHTNPDAVKLSRKFGTNSESEGLSAWANGASDHLRDLQIPVKFKGTEIGNLLTKIQVTGLEMGDGYTGRVWTMNDYAQLREWTFEVARLLDKELGVKSIKADWE